MNFICLEFNQSLCFITDGREIMKVATFNANSIRTRLPIICDWLTMHDPDILGIQETKVQDKDFPSDAFVELGYNVYFRGEKSYNGVAILSKEEAQNIQYGFDDGGPIDDTRLIRASFGNIEVINTYIPQGRAIDHVMYKYKLNWYKRIRSLFDKYYSTDQSIVWLGDMNIAIEPIDVNQPKTKMNDPCYHQDAKDGFIHACDFGFTDLLRKHHAEDVLYSFFDYRVKDAVDRNIGWRIDYILSTQSLLERCKDCYIDIEPRKKDKPSDHTFVIAEFYD